MQKYNLRSLHWVMLRKVDLKLIGFISIESSRGTVDFNHPPLKIIGDLVFKTSRGIDLPLNKFLLEAIASNLTESLESGVGGAGHAWGWRTRENCCCETASA